MVAELLDAHRCICAQTSFGQVILHPADDRSNEKAVSGRPEDRYENRERYNSEALFHTIFIVIDTIPALNSFSTRVRDDRAFVAATPVLMVRTGEFHDWKAGPIDFASIESLSEKMDGNPHVRRIDSGHAVDFILDLQRRNSDPLCDFET